MDGCTPADREFDNLPRSLSSVLIVTRKEQEMRSRLDTGVIRGVA